MVFPKDLSICDPHFHLWDTISSPNPNLGGIVDAPHPTNTSAPKLGLYLAETFLADVSTLPFVAALHVETVVGQQPGGYVLDTVAETAFVSKEAARCLLTSAGGPLKKYGIVAFAQLSEENAAEVIERHEKACAPGELRGIRMILNFDENDPTVCWPQVGHSQYLTGTLDTFNKNVSALASRGLTFDTHVNWFQLSQAASYFLKHAPETTLILDHLGCLKLKLGGKSPSPSDEDAKDAEEDRSRFSVWKEGISALAANPKANIKISGLEYIVPGWMEAGSSQRSFAVEIVAYVIKAFGESRCMVASNFPVDLTMGKKSLVDLYDCLYEVVTLAAPGLTQEQLGGIFHDNAVRVYGL